MKSITKEEIFKKFKKEILQTNVGEIPIQAMYVAMRYGHGEYCQITDTMSFENCVRMIDQLRLENPDDEYQIIAVLDY